MQLYCGFSVNLWIIWGSWRMSGGYILSIFLFTGPRQHESKRLAATMPA